MSPINKAALDQASAARKKYRADTPISLQSIEGEDAVFIAAYLEAVRAPGDAHPDNCPTCGKEKAFNYCASGHRWPVVTMPNCVFIKALQDARIAIEQLHHHGNFDNGVYDATGSICEGVVRTGEYVNSVLQQIDEALATKQESYAAPSPICPTCQQTGKGGCDEYHCEVSSAGHSVNPKPDKPVPLARKTH